MIGGLLLLAGWMWDRPLMDCSGMPETSLSHYFFMATVRQNSPAICFDDQGQPYSCSVVQALPPIRFQATPDPGFGPSASTDSDPVGNPELLPLPPLDGLTAWPWISSENPYAVIAVDTAGNESAACQ